MADAKIHKITETISSAYGVPVSPDLRNTKEISKTYGRYCKNSRKTEINANFDSEKSFLNEKKNRKNERNRKRNQRDVSMKRNKRTRKNCRKNTAQKRKKLNSFYIHRMIISNMAKSYHIESTKTTLRCPDSAASTFGLPSRSLRFSSSSWRIHRRACPRTCFLRSLIRFLPSSRFFALKRASF